MEPSNIHQTQINQKPQENEGVTSKPKNIISGLKRKRSEEDVKNSSKNKRLKQSSNLLKTVLNYQSSESSESDNSEESDSSEYDFIKKAKQNNKSNSTVVGLNKGLAKKVNADSIKKALNETNKVAQEIFSMLPGAKLAKGQQAISISGGLQQNREIQFAELTKTDVKTKDGGIQHYDGIININKSELINKEDYEREKIRQLSRAEFQQERYERMNRLMPNKNDRSKNNIRSLAFDISGSLEQERIQSQKTFNNAKKKYGW